MNRSLHLTAELLRRYSRRGNFHSDIDAAATIGYSRLVAQGMQAAAPAYGLLLDEWGDGFLAGGTIELKFVGMVVDDETVDADVELNADSDSDSATISVSVGDRAVVVGHATRGTA